MSGQPARRYSWQPFERGNRAALKHGAQSATLIEERARELSPAVFSANPHLGPERDAPAVMRYCRALARVERVSAWLDERDDPVFADVESGEMHGVFERLERWERQASKLEEQLCISPLTRSRLGLDLLAAKRATLADFRDGDGDAR